MSGTRDEVIVAALRLSDARNEMEAAMQHAKNIVRQANLEGVSSTRIALEIGRFSKAARTIFFMKEV